MSLVATRSALVRPFSSLAGGADFQTSVVEVFTTQMVTPPDWARRAFMLLIGGGAPGCTGNGGYYAGPGGDAGEVVPFVAEITGAPFLVQIGSGGGDVVIDPSWPQYEGQEPFYARTNTDGGATTALGCTALGGRFLPNSPAYFDNRGVRRFLGGSPGGKGMASGGVNIHGGNGGSGYRGRVKQPDNPQQRSPAGGEEVTSVGGYAPGTNGSGGRAATAGDPFPSQSQMGGQPGGGPGAGGGGAAMYGSQGGLGASGAAIITFIS